MKRVLTCSALVLTAAAASAHPHAWVDQQAVVSLDRGLAIIDYRVVPSSKDGAHMFDHLDTDHDGRLSTAELHGYAAALLRSTRLIVDGRGVPLGPLSASVPPRAVMASGTGLMSVKAMARLPLAPTHQHVITLRVDFSLFKHGWFIQPFYGAALRQGTLPSLARQGDGVTIIVPASKQPGGLSSRG